MYKKVSLLSLFVLFAVAAVFVLGFTGTIQPLYYKTYPIVNIIVNQQKVLPAEGDVPAFQIDGRTMVPIRLVAEAFNAEVTWDESTRTVIITKADYIPPVVSSELNKNLIKFSQYQLNSTQTRLTGKIENLHKVDVDVAFRIDFYDRNDKYLGHVHVDVRDLENSEIRSFEALLPEEIKGYSKTDTVIESLKAH